MSSPQLNYCVSPGEDRSHSVYRYTDQIYKVVQWYTVRGHFGPGPAENRLPRKLINSEYMNWTAYMEKFGFCSFGRINNPVAAGFYITKYITKDNDRMVQDVGLA